jgi:5'/3'-nucleotidase SurE
MSRFDDVEMRVTDREGHSVYTLSGTPADCAAVGCYHVDFEGSGDGDSSARPDLVVSGINLGANFGTAFFLSSGTVGAALEGAIAGVPAVALSLILGDEARASMSEGTPPSDAPGAAAAAARVVAAALAAVRSETWPSVRVEASMYHSRHSTRFMYNSLNAACVSYLPVTTETKQPRYNQYLSIDCALCPRTSTC